MHKLRLTGKKEVLLNRIREHLEVKNAGDVKYPVTSFILNCKGDACKGDVVMFEQNIYRRKKGAPHEVQGRLCGQRTNAGRIIKESYGTAKQQHTFTIEILWSKGYKPWPPLHPLLIKGRNLYKDKTMRQPWPDEQERKRVLEEKHARGFVARKSRAVRIQEKEMEKMARSNRIKVNKSKEQQNMNLKSSQEVVQRQKVETMKTVHQRSNESKGPSHQNAEPGKARLQHIPSNASPTQQNVVLPQNGATRTFKQGFINHQTPSIQPGMTRLQQIPSNAAPTQQNVVVPQNGATRTFKQEFISHQVPSIQHGGSHQQIFSKPTHTQQMNRVSHQQPNFQHREDVLLQEGAMRTSRKEFTDLQAPSQHIGGSGVTRLQQMSPKQGFKYQQQPTRHQDHNEALPQDGVKKAYSEDFTNHQNNTYRATRNDESAFQHQGKSTQHANAYQRGSSRHQNTRANHQAHQPLRTRNQDFNSRGQFYGQDYNYQDYDDYMGSTQYYYHPEQNWQQNYYDRRQATQGQYHTQQNHHQNYNSCRRTNQKQYHPQQNQPQRFPKQRPQRQPCDFYYRNGWCGFGENCRYSHGTEEC